MRIAGLAEGVVLRGDWRQSARRARTTGEKSAREGLLAEHLNTLLSDFPALILGSYPEFSNPEYRVKVTLESRDAGYVGGALERFLARLPADAVVKVT